MMTKRDRKIEAMQGLREYEEPQMHIFSLSLFGDIMTDTVTSSLDDENEPGPELPDDED